MLRRVLPGRIATQLVVLVALSAIIFHFCMSGAFLLNRTGWFRTLHPGAVTRLDHAAELVEAAPASDRAAVLRAVAPDVLEKIIAKIPRARLGSVEDIARGVVFLAADEADWITGSTLSINGGQYMY